MMLNFRVQYKHDQLFDQRLKLAHKATGCGCYVAGGFARALLLHQKGFVTLEMFKNAWDIFSSHDVDFYCESVGVLRDFYSFVDSTCNVSKSKYSYNFYAGLAGNKAQIIHSKDFIGSATEILNKFDITNCKVAFKVHNVDDCDHVCDIEFFCDKRLYDFERQKVINVDNWHSPAIFSRLLKYLNTFNTMEDYENNTKYRLSQHTKDCLIPALYEFLENKDICLTFSDNRSFKNQRMLREHMIHSVHKLINFTDYDNVSELLKFSLLNTKFITSRYRHLDVTKSVLERLHKIKTAAQ